MGGRGMGGSHTHPHHTRVGAPDLDLVLYLPHYLSSIETLALTGVARMPGTRGFAARLAAHSRAARSSL